MELLRILIRTKEGNILLVERQVDRGQGIKRGKLARIDLDQADMRDRFGECG